MLKLSKEKFWNFTLVHICSKYVNGKGQRSYEVKISIYNINRTQRQMTRIIVSEYEPDLPKDIFSIFKVFSMKKDKKSFENKASSCNTTNYKHHRNCWNAKTKSIYKHTHRGTHVHTHTHPHTHMHTYTYWSSLVGRDQHIFYRTTVEKFNSCYSKMYMCLFEMGLFVFSWNILYIWWSFLYHAIQVYFVLWTYQ